MVAPGTRLRVLVVDDSALYRKVVRDVLVSLPDVEVVGVATNGRQALEKLAELKPDVVTLDLEMPELDGIGVLRELQTQHSPALAIMVSAFTARGAQTTTQALQLGAFDFILKPNTNSVEESVQQLRRDLAPKLLSCRVRVLRTDAPGIDLAPKRPEGSPAAATLKGSLRPEVVALGVSTGGPKALSTLLPRFPANFRCPILLVQHMPPLFTKSLADDLNKRCALEVLEATEGQQIRAGQVLIAPGGKHMRVAEGPQGKVIQLTDDAPERNCRPSVDYLFRSVAEKYGSRSLAVVLTGMGDDGALGASHIKRVGGHVFTQDEQSCVVYGMPKMVADKGLSDLVVPLERMHRQILEFAHEKVMV